MMAGMLKRTSLLVLCTWLAENVSILCEVVVEYRSQFTRCGQAALVIFASFALACTSDQIVYREDGLASPGADSVSGMLGYRSVSEKLTVCGGCHADEQLAWSETGHSDAWAGLQSSDHAADYCESCHTVNELGNYLTEAAGYNAIPDSSYHDVQCESCHGPAAEHISDPMAVKPLASIAASEDATNGCGECHNGEHHPFVDQWSESAHGAVPHQSSAIFVEKTLGSGPCLKCHEGRRALEVQFSVSSDFLEKGGEEAMPLTCVVCHDPHGAPNAHQIRAPLSGLTTDNLCIKCHNTRTVPGATTHGPHGAQGPLVLGESVGWWPPGFEWLDGLTGTHGDADANPRLCATCHVAGFVVTEPEFFQSVGHSFEAVPCLDANGIPTTGTCANSERSFGACVDCHGSEANALDTYEDFIEELSELLELMWVDSNQDLHLDAAPTDAGLLAEIIAAVGPKELDVSDTLFTMAEGLLWNAQVAATDQDERFRGFELVLDSGDTVEIGGHPTSGNGVHNPPFLEALLNASLVAGADFYGLPRPAAVNLALIEDGAGR